MKWWFTVWQLVTLPAPEASAHIQDGTLALEKRHSKGLALSWNLRKLVLGILIRMFLGLLDRHPDPAPDPSIIKQKGSVCVWASRIGIRIRYSEVRIRGSGSASGSEDPHPHPDLYQNVTDPQH
jgi:hypothetical protein